MRYQRVDGGVCCCCRVFLLLVSLGQRSLSSSKSCELLESVLVMLAKILAPLIATQAQHSARASRTSGQSRQLLFFALCMCT